MMASTTSSSISVKPFRRQQCGERVMAFLPRYGCKEIGTTGAHLRRDEGEAQEHTPPSAPPENTASQSVAKKTAIVIVLSIAIWERPRRRSESSDPHRMRRGGRADGPSSHSATLLL